jgi:hypothetical protein
MIRAILEMTQVVVFSIIIITIEMTRVVIAAAKKVIGIAHPASNIIEMNRVVVIAENIIVMDPTVWNIIETNQVVVATVKNIITITRVVLNTIETNQSTRIIITIITLIENKFGHYCKSDESIKFMI